MKYYWYYYTFIKMTGNMKLKFCKTLYQNTFDIKEMRSTLKHSIGRQNEVLNNQTIN